MAKEAKMVKVVLLRDFWPSESTDTDNRVRAGEIIELSESDAKRAMAAGLASFEGLSD